MDRAATGAAQQAPLSALRYGLSEDEFAALKLELDAAFIRERSPLARNGRQNAADAPRQADPPPPAGETP